MTTAAATHAPGDRLAFTGRSGHRRTGSIDKIWTAPDGTALAHVRTDPLYTYERTPLYFVVCLDPAGHDAHPFALIDTATATP